MFGTSLIFMLLSIFFYEYVDESLFDMHEDEEKTGQENKVAEFEENLEEKKSAENSRKSSLISTKSKESNISDTSETNL
jgi:hypothetical protein